jgi:type IV secretion system protein VirD4
MKPYGSKPKYSRNKNVLIIGGSGSGKTRFFVKPNLMQCHSSYVVTDPKGGLLCETGKMLQANGYVLKTLNTINFNKSMHYNPFQYIRSEKDILKLVNTLLANTKGDGEKSGEDFWLKAERLYYCALIGYIWYEAPEREKNFTTLLEMINASETREEDESFQNEVDKMFAELAQENPEHFAVRQYQKFKLSAGKTAKSILVSCGARLAPFDIQEVRNLMEYDELELDTLGDRKTALFLIMSDTDTTFNFIIAMLQSQLFNLLCDKADDVYGGRLPVHVRCLLDEFANIGQIPQFDKLIATIRSREISACIILQAQSQLKTMYKDAADTIVGNCDAALFLGGKESGTLKELSETLGKTTIDLMNTSDSRGTSRSYGLNYQKTGRALMERDELAVLDGELCILQLRGVRPFLSKKFDITKHKRYKMLKDADDRNAFDIEAYMKCRAKVKQRDEFELYEL